MSQLLGMDNIISSLQGNYNKTNAEAGKTSNTKNTIGEPKLSETAASYYEELKAKHGNVEFVLVDKANIATAKEQAANIQSNKSMIVLISEDEVEQMASDKNIRDKNEKLITDAKAQMPDLLAQLKKSATDIKFFGMEFNDDGTTSFFAVLDKSMGVQSAGSIDELLKKIQDITYEAKADSIVTPQEKMVGQSFDFSI